MNKSFSKNMDSNKEFGACKCPIMFFFVEKMTFKEVTGC